MTFPTLNTWAFLAVFGSFSSRVASRHGCISSYHLDMPCTLPAEPTDPQIQHFQHERPTVRPSRALSLVRHFCVRLRVSAEHVASLQFLDRSPYRVGALMASISAALLLYYRTRRVGVCFAGIILVGFERSLSSKSSWSQSKRCALKRCKQAHR